MPGEQRAGWTRQEVCNCSRREPCQKCAVEREFDPFDLRGITFQGVPLGDGGPFFLSEAQWVKLGMGEGSEE